MNATLLSPFVTTAAPLLTSIMVWTWRGGLMLLALGRLTRPLEASAPPARKP